eukprot:167300-Karenia_brevis.AAC.1
MKPTVCDAQYPCHYDCKHLTEYGRGKRTQTQVRLSPLVLRRAVGTAFDMTNQEHNDQMWVRSPIFTNQPGEWI